MGIGPFSFNKPENDYAPNTAVITPEPLLNNQSKTPDLLYTGINTDAIGQPTSVSSINSYVTNDRTGKYIGVSDYSGISAPGGMLKNSPLQAGTSSKGMLKNPESVTTQGKSITTNNTTDTTNTTLPIAQGVIQSLNQSNGNAAQDRYNQEMTNWQNNEKYWFNPNSNLKPDIEKYMAQMPSSLESIKKGSWVNGMQSKSDAGQILSGGSILNPAGVKLHDKPEIVNDLINPLNVFDKWQGDGFANYVGSKAAEGALSSGLIGGLTGMIQGIFGWQSAKAKDAAIRAQKLAQYEQELQQWTVARNKRVLDEQNAELDRQRVARTTQGTIDKTNNETLAKNRVDSATVNRQQIANLLSSLGTQQQASRQAQIQRWS